MRPFQSINVSLFSVHPTIQTIKNLKCRHFWFCEKRKSVLEKNQTWLKGSNLFTPEWKMNEVNESHCLYCWRRGHSQAIGPSTKENCNTPNAKKLSSLNFMQIGAKITKQSFRCPFAGKGLGHAQVHSRFEVRNLLEPQNICFTQSGIPWFV